MNKQLIDTETHRYIEKDSSIDTEILRQGDRYIDSGFYVYFGAASLAYECKLPVTYKV